MYWLLQQHFGNCFKTRQPHWSWHFAFFKVSTQSSSLPDLPKAVNTPIKIPLGSISNGKSTIWNQHICIRFFRPFQNFFEFYDKRPQKMGASLPKSGLRWLEFYLVSDYLPDIGQIFLKICWKMGMLPSNQFQMEEYCVWKCLFVHLFWLKFSSSVFCVRMQVTNRVLLGHKLSYIFDFPSSSSFCQKGRNVLPIWCKMAGIWLKELQDAFSKFMDSA